MFSIESGLGQFVRLLQQMANTLDGVFFLYDADEMRLIHVSANYSRLSGQKDEELFQDHTSFLKVVHPDDREKAAAWFCKGLAGEISSSELRILLSYGEVRWVAACVGPIRDKTGKVVRLTGLVLDITRRINAEEDLRKSHAQLHQFNKMETLGRVAAGVAHEILNPISTLMFNTALLIDLWADMRPYLEEMARKDPQAKFGNLPVDMLTSRLGDLLDDTNQVVKRVANIANHLKEFARPAPLSPDNRASLNLAVERAVSLASTTARKSGMTLQTVLDGGLPHFPADPTGLEEIVINLLTNAIEAIDRDNGRIEVRTGHTASGEAIYLEVADNGRGIPEGIADRLYEPFVTQRRDGSGTGLGLSVTRRLVEEFGGSISHSSKAGEGTVFRVVFPLSSSSRSTRVLVVDDNQGMRSLLQKAIGTHPGMLVQVASCGMEALGKLERFTPDLVVMDLFMPGMDGMELCGRIRENAGLGRVPILVITGFPDSQEGRTILESGLAEILAKPFKVDSLMAKVKELLAKAGKGD